MSSVYARRSGVKGAHPVAAGVKIIAVSPVFLMYGRAVPFAAADQTGKFAGIATFEVDNTDGADGDLRVEIEKEQIALLNEGDIAVTDVGAMAYFATDATVSSDDGGGTRPVAGTISELDGALVWIQPALV